MSQNSLSDQVCDQKVFTTQHMAGISYEELDLDHAANLTATTSGLTQLDSGSPLDNDEQTRSLTKRVEAKDFEKLIKNVFVGGNNNFNSTLWTGSGVMVGKNILLTAGHVAPWNVQGWWMRFVPAFKNGSEPLGSSYVAEFRGYNKPGEVSGLDYAICKLNTPLGDSTSYMGCQYFGKDNGYYTGSWTSVGYPAEPTNPGANFMIVEDSVKIVDVDDEGSTGKELESNLYSLGGWSGGPLWAYLDNQPRVIGVMSGNETDLFQPRHTVSAGGKALLDLISWGRANW